MMLLKFWIRIRKTAIFCVEAVGIFGVLMSKFIECLVRDVNSEKSILYIKLM